jgi:outer membrane receptor protein involved in Fe transport
LLACALIMALASPVAANTDGVDLDEVIVIASRRPVGSDDLSAALSLIDREDVLLRKLTTDALASNVGVYLQQTTPGQGAAIIRGLKGSAILHLVDGMPLSNALFRSAPTPYLALVPTTAIERIEVVRGTPASLYGNQAVGGVIQVVSRRPDFDSDEMQIHREVMLAFDTSELQKSVKGLLDFGNRDLAATLSGEYLTTGNRRIGGGDRISPSGYSAKAARFAVSGTPSAARSWLLDFHYLEQPKTPRIDELVPGYGQTEPSSSEFFFSPSRRMFAHAQHISNDTLFELDWRIDAAWQRVEDDRTTRSFEEPTRRYEANQSDLYSMSVSAAGASSVTSWIVGVDLQTDEISSRRIAEDIDTMLSTTVPSRFPDASRIDQAAVFGNVDWLVSDHHRFNGGLRYTGVEIDIPDTPVNDAATIKVQRFSGDLGWTYSFSESWQMVANAGYGFRAPNISDLGTLGDRPGNRFNIPNTGLREEHVQQFDIGVRRHTEDIRFELMIYTLSFDDRITSVFTGNVTPDGRDIVQSVNAAETSVHGAELGLDIDIRDNVTAHAVVNYTWGRESLGTEAAQPADRIPPLSGKLALQIDLSAAWSVESWLRFSSDQDRLSDRDIRDVRINPDGTAGWAILGTRATWMPTPVWTIDLVADNLLDKQYRVHGSGIDATGRNFAITVRMGW